MLISENIPSKNIVNNKNLLTKFIPSKKKRMEIIINIPPVIGTFFLLINFLCPKLLCFSINMFFFKQTKLKIKNTSSIEKKKIINSNTIVL